MINLSLKLNLTAFVKWKDNDTDRKTARLVSPNFVTKFIWKNQYVIFVQYFFCKDFEHNLITLSYITAPLKVDCRDFFLFFLF